MALWRWYLPKMINKVMKYNYFCLLLVLRGQCYQQYTRVHPPEQILKQKYQRVKDTIQMHYGKCKIQCFGLKVRF